MTEYAIVRVTDKTPADLEYGDYRGLAVIDATTGETLTDGDEWVHPATLDAARAWIANREGVNFNAVEAEEDGYPNDWYGQVWDVTINAEGDDDQEIPEHVRRAVVRAIEANDYNNIDALPAGDRDLARKYLTRLVAYMTPGKPQ